MSGQSHGNAKLNDAVVRDIRAQHDAGEQTKTLAQRFGVSPASLSNVVNRRTWSHVRATGQYRCGQLRRAAVWVVLTQSVFPASRRRRYSEHLQTPSKHPRLRGPDNGPSRIVRSMEECVVVHRRLVALVIVAVATLAACDDGDDSHAEVSAPSSGTVTPTQQSAVRDEAAVERRMTSVPDAAVGRIGDTNALVAVVAGGGQIQAYVCDGENIDLGGELDQASSGALSRWFRGAWDGQGPATLTNGPFTLTVSGQDGSYAGELVLATGERLPFTATPAADGDGLYKVERYDSYTGAVNAAGDSIVFDGDERGAFIPVVTRCRRVRKTVVLADGTTASIIVEICGT